MLRYGMEILLTFAGTGLAALLTQQKPLPSDADLTKALEKLDKNPDDPDANLVAGKYKAFIMGDYKEAMPFFAKSNDKTLKPLAERELDPARTATALLKVEMGDEWILAARKFPALFRAFYERAQQWYIEAWSKLDEAAKLKLREQGRKLAAARPPGGKRPLPRGWTADMAAAGARAPEMDGTIARTGSYSVKLSPGDPKVPGSSSILRSEPIAANGKKLELTAYVRTDGTDSPSDQVFVSFFDRNGMALGTWGPQAKVDTPFWERVSIKMDVPDAVTTVHIGVFFRSKSGALWVDDFSLKFDGKEALKNPSFEER